MPYMRDGATKVSDHWVRSPLLNKERACLPCHHFSADEMQARVDAIQDRNHELLQNAGAALMDLLYAIEAAREAGIITFACSGNRGRLDRLTIPGCYSSTVSVGSVRDDAPDQLWSLTSRGPVLDLLAPGEMILHRFDRLATRGERLAFGERRGKVALQR